MTGPRRRWSGTVALFLGFTLLPILWLGVLSLQPNHVSKAEMNLLPAPVTAENYLFILTEPDWVRGFANAAIYVTLNVAITLAVALPAAYGFSRFRFFGDGQAFFLVLVFRMVPPAIVMLPLVQMYSAAGLLDTHLSVALAHCLFTVPIAIWILEGFISSVPRELDEAAKVDGHSGVGFFFRVLLPQIRTGIAVTAFLCFVFSWAEFTLANALTTVDSKPIGVVMKIVASPTGAVHVGIAAAASILMLLPGAVFAWLLRRHLARGFSLGRLGW